MVKNEAPVETEYVNRPCFLKAAYVLPMLKPVKPDRKANIIILKYIIGNIFSLSVECK